jgi:hypothetical protein
LSGHSLFKHLVVEHVAFDDVQRCDGFISQPVCLPQKQRQVNILSVYEKIDNVLRNRAAGSDNQYIFHFTDKQPI